MASGAKDSLARYRRAVQIIDCGALVIGLDDIVFGDDAYTAGDIKSWST